MPLSALLFLPLALQAGNAPALPQAPIEIQRRKPAPGATVRPAIRLAGPLEQCLALAKSDPAAAEDLAQAWLAKAKGSARAEPGRCLGVALSAQEQWGQAESAFLAARDDTAANERANRARLGAMAGNAALADGAPDRALAALDAAHGDALGAGDPHLAALFSIDRARALVLLKRDSDALSALAEARSGAADDPQAWLLSATLSRRLNQLAEAQQQIEQAATLAPLDPEVGLEAGVIAALGGRDDAARRSFQSVIKATPDSEAARRAQQYLDQLGPVAAPSVP
ncbi:hypothetical protein [Novosphingobium sp. B 225]|uniref:hypothetical protein n=1 Tax=Novosphingobium sp. B 225 TaxID=1961849 RepID=UPI000B4C1630|nr:hypothetical protein [Novosphingobium sp. B 225]